MRRHLLAALIPLTALSLWLASRGSAVEEVPQPARPQYNLRLDLDYKLLTFSADGSITIPVRNGDSISDAVFFIYANAPGVTGNDATHNNIVVDEVLFTGQKVPFTLNGAVLRVKLPAPQAGPVKLDFKWRGVVPRGPAGSGGLLEAMGGMDLGGLLGGDAGNAPKKDPDYGVYSYANGVLSLGSFWYPSLAVRQNGQWMDEPPSGVGDVGFSEASDFYVFGKKEEDVSIVDSENCPRFPAILPPGTFVHRAENVRDFAIMASRDFVSKGQVVEVASKQVRVDIYLTKPHAAKLDRALDIAVNAIQIYSKKFGPYPYSEFKVVEGPMRGGAGGMEFSGMVSIAAFLFDDMNKQMNDLAQGLGVGGLDKMLAGLGLGDEDAGAANDAGNADANPAQDMLGGMLGQQKQIFDSLLEVTIAHEAGHQWWAMGVGSDAQRLPWQDESLTNYTAMLYFEGRYGKQKAGEMMELHLKSAYSMGRMLGSPDAPVNLATNKYVNSMQYGAVVYGKGALYYDALRTVVGDEAFFAALREYYATYNGKLAPPNSLLAIMKAKAPAKSAQIDALYKRWIEGMNGDQDVAGGKVAGVEDLLGGLLGGMLPGGDE